MCSEGYTTPSLEFVLKAARKNIWLKFWDTALDHGESLYPCILKLLCMTVFNDRKCPSEECDFMYPKLPLYDYVLTSYKTTCTNLPPETTPNSLIDLIISSCNDSEYFQEILQLGL